MNKQKIANELVKLAKSIASKNITSTEVREYYKFDQKEFMKTMENLISNKLKSYFDNVKSQNTGASMKFSFNVGNYRGGAVLFFEENVGSVSLVGKIECSNRKLVNIEQECSPENSLTYLAREISEKISDTFAANNV